ncbi:hypothetical protein [Comamonas odontotermitis]|uniref:hypothetical protein n=1 Tax=Comamonas odontotermitis TaxID=379895 RepID=UPI00375296DA
MLLSAAMTPFNWPTANPLENRTNPAMTITHTPANAFTQEAEEAKATWLDAQARLRAAREAFNTGAVVRLKEIFSNQDSLKAKLEAARLEREKAESEFKSAFEAAGFEKTAAVQKILNKKNDAIAICEELESAIASMKAECAEHQPLFMQASIEAETYQAAHGSAFSAGARFHAFALLEKHGPAMADALALICNVRSGNAAVEADIGPSLGFSPETARITLESRMSVLLSLLRSKSMEAPSGITQPIADAIGTLDLGPMNGRKLLTPADHHKLRFVAENRTA